MISCSNFFPEGSMKLPFSNFLTAMNPTYLLLPLAITCFTCADSAHQAKLSQQEVNKEATLLANEEIFNKGNLAFTDQVFSGEHEGGGPEMMKQYFGYMRAAFPDIQVQIDPIIGEGNKTAWLRVHTGTHTKEFMGFQPTGKKITWKTMVISEHDEEGLVTKEWYVSNLIEKLQQASDSLSGESAG